MFKVGILPTFFLALDYLKSFFKTIGFAYPPILSVKANARKPGYMVSLYEAWVGPEQRNKQISFCVLGCCLQNLLEKSGDRFLGDEIAIVYL